MDWNITIHKFPNETPVEQGWYLIWVEHDNNRWIEMAIWNGTEWETSFGDVQNTDVKFYTRIPKQEMLQQSV